MTANSERESPWRGSRWRLLLWALPTGLLIAPAVAMRFSEEVQWSAFDFAFGFVLLFGTTGAIDFAIRKGGHIACRLGASLAVLTAFLLVWINGAVGMIGNEDNPANLMFLGVIGIAAVGAAIARFETRGMARAMLAAASAQAAIAVLVLVRGWGGEDPPGTIGLTMLIGTFAVLWGLAAALFDKAAYDQARVN